MTQSWNVDAEDDTVEISDQMSRYVDAVKKIVEPKN